MRIDRYMSPDEAAKWWREQSKKRNGRVIGRG
jgi:hypothetical protein